MNESRLEWLSAAQCALRTGLTVRALRVYENYGLIKPGRSAAGWRRYGAQELLQLNQISLLKVLGLTLNQIRDMLRRPTSPTLRQLLELQRDAWTQRRSQAERGQAVAEAALQQMQAGRSLSLDELCSLIRSLELITSTAVAANSANEDAARPDTSLLDRFVGHYARKPGFGVSTLTRTGNSLILEPIGQPPLELEQTGEADFSVPRLDLVLCFEPGEEDAARCLVVWHRGVATRLERTDAQTAQSIKQAIVDRVTKGIPAPGGQEALRRLLDSGRAGTPEYELMSPEFAEVARGQQSYWQIVGQHFGPIVSMELVCVSPQGWDIYQVQHQNDLHRYRIAMGNDGKVHGFSEASAEAQRRAVV
jgi:DNA-binding transcriptional MerR regulator